jgi:hypothetical protein
MQKLYFLFYGCGAVVNSRYSRDKEAASQTRNPIRWTEENQENIFFPYNSDSLIFMNTSKALIIILAGLDYTIELHVFLEDIFNKVRKSLVRIKLL